MMMKSAFAALACLVASACAQSISISSPSAGANVTPAGSLAVQLTQPNTQSPFTDVAVVIAMVSCQGYTGGCGSFDASQVLGQILYSGPVNAEQTLFTVTVPASMAQGPAVLTVTNFELVGAGPSPYMHTSNVTVNVQ